MTEPADANQPGPDPSNAPIEELITDLDPDDDVYQRVDYVEGHDLVEETGGEGT